MQYPGTRYPVLLEEFCVVGLTEIKAAAQASTLYVTMRGKTRVG
eukprot:SAG11_NODE_10012_length_862_cov_2.904325_1_plen_43_part_10